MSEYEIESDVEELDDSWIKEIEEEEKEYNSFYKEENELIKVFYVYINKENKIYYVKKEDIMLEDKKIDKTKLVFLLKLYIIPAEIISCLIFTLKSSNDEIEKSLSRTDK